MLHFVELFHLTMVYHFHDMIDMLINCVYKKGTTLFGHGYDFHQSNRYFPICGLILMVLSLQAQDAVTVVLPGRTDKVMAGLRTKLETAY
jgi:hypothetical protein